jgi:hypothetical protein
MFSLFVDPITHGLYQKIKLIKLLKKAGGRRQRAEGFV